ncbi:classical arabinogalactan protein 9-like [Miscanthus floridulus]|uniref:classical arabinogalactan protein 9-like n=1 Tax=Miscanthus floridulus TaxID=154761 RepID=UPI0034599960
MDAVRLPNFTVGAACTAVACPSLTPPPPPQRAPRRSSARPVRLLPRRVARVRRAAAPAPSSPSSLTLTPHGTQLGFAVQLPVPRPCRPLRPRPPPFYPPLVDRRQLDSAQQATQPPPVRRTLLPSREASPPLPSPPARCRVESRPGSD